MSVNSNPNEEMMIFVQFCDGKGRDFGDTIQLPSTTTTAVELNAILKMVLEDDPPEEESKRDGQFGNDSQSQVTGERDYQFEVNERKIEGSLESFIRSNNLSDFSKEKTLKIVFSELKLSNQNRFDSRTLNGHSDSVLCIAFSPCAKNLASGSGDTTVRFWDKIKGTPKHEETHENEGGILDGQEADSRWVLVVSWSPNGKMLASGDRHGLINIFNGETGQKISKKGLKGHRSWITSLTWEPIHLNVKSTRLASASNDGTIGVWEVSEMKCVLLIAGAHEKSITKLIWGGQCRLYSASADGSVKIWRGYDGSCVKVLLGGNHSRINSLSVNTEFVLKAGVSSLIMSSRNIESNKFNINEIDDVESQDGIELIREQSSEIYYRIRGEGQCEKIVSGSDDGSVVLWDSDTSEEKSKKQLSGNTIGKGGQKGQQAAQHVSKKKKNSNLIVKMVGHRAPVNHVLFSPDGKWIASASFDKDIRLWSVEKAVSGAQQACVAVLKGHQESVYQISWAPCSRYLVSASKDTKVNIWDVEKKRVCMAIEEHVEEVYAVDWSGDGKYIASGGKDRTLKVFDIKL